jgi:hypothetical protein
MLSRNDALNQIQSLITENNISSSEILALYSTTSTSSGGLLQSVLLYIGGALIFTGLCVYISMNWGDLNSLSRVIISLGSGLISFILGLLCLGDARFSKAATPLFLIAAALQPTGLFVFIDEYLPHTGEVAKAASVVFGIMTIQQTIAFATSNRTSLLFFSLFFFYAFLSALMHWLEIEAPEGPLAIGVTALMVSWGVAQTNHKSIIPFLYFCASSLTAAASFDLLQETPYDTLLIGVSASLIYFSIIASSRTVLTIGVISLLASLGYYTGEYFRNIVGWPIALIVMGFIMLGISVFAVKLGKKIAKQEG